MVAYSFRPQFRAPILAGTKHQTIRSDRKRHARPGEEVQLYTGMRTRQCAIIGRAECLAVEPIRMRPTAGRGLLPFVEAPSLGLITRPRELDAFARSDGFGNWEALRAFWAEEHEAVTEVFAGVRVRWGPLLGDGLEAEHG